MSRQEALITPSVMRWAREECASVARSGVQTNRPASRGDRSLGKRREKPLDGSGPQCVRGL